MIQGIDHQIFEVLDSFNGSVAALGFARQHGLEEGSSDVWLKELRMGKEDGTEKAS